MRLPIVVESQTKIKFEMRRAVHAMFVRFRHVMA